MQTAEPGHYLALYKELEGDILASQGRREAAAQAYRAALTAAPDESTQLRASIQNKLENLGDAGALS